MVDFPHGGGATIWRDFNELGNPASKPCEPKKPEIRDWTGVVEANINAALAGTGDPAAIATILDGLEATEAAANNATEQAAAATTTANAASDAADTATTTANAAAEAVALKADKSVTVSAAGLLSGGGTLDSPVTLTAPRATSEQIAAGATAGIMTPADVNTMLGPVVVSTEKDFATAMVESVTQLISADGARMLQFDLSGNMLGVSIVTEYDFASSLDDEPAVLLSSDYAELQKYGTESGPDTYLKPYVSGTQLRAIGQTDYLLHEMGSKSVLATYAVSDDYVTAIINMPSIGPATAYKVVPDLPWLFPAERRVLHIAVLIGQSLAEGSHSDVNPTLTGQTRDGALMLSLSGYTDVRLGRSPTAVTAISGSEIIGFEPLTPKPSVTSTQYVQTLLESMAFTLA
ncbi:hypothetical protein, partial [Ancylobacter sonchi]